MIAAKHVPGPWEICVEPPNDMWHRGLTIGAANPLDARRICDLPALAHPDINAANGALICAAPELLAVAVAVLNSVPFHASHARLREALVAVINKATAGREP